MSILLVESDSHARDSLQALLSGLGLRPILHARNLREAQRQVQAQGSSIRLILLEARSSGADANSFIAWLNTVTLLKNTPCLVMNSNLPFWRTRGLRRNPRVDAVLSKPFGGPGLFSGLCRADRQRRRARNHLLLIHNQPGSDLVRWCQEITERSRYWKEVTVVEDLNSARSVSRRGLGIGGVLIDPSTYDQALRRGQPEWLRTFRRSREGSGIPCAILGRSPDLPKNLRTFGTIFTNWPSAKSFVEDLLTTLYRRKECHFSTNVHLAVAFRLIQAGHGKLAARCAETAFLGEPTRVEALFLSGEAWMRAGEWQSAEASFRRAIDLNPFHPPSHIRLLEILRLRHSEWNATLQKARAYCSEHPTILRLTRAVEAAA